LPLDLPKFELTLSQLLNAFTQCIHVWGHHMKKLLLAGISTLALVAAGSANAADLPIKAPPPAVAAPVPWTWTGFYVGAHIGSAWASEDWTDPFEGKSLVASGNLNGFLGGFQAGYNYQINWVVLGVEGDFSWANVNGTLGGFFCEEEFACNSNKEWFSTVTGRIGGTIDHALLYVKGGVAWVDDKHNISVIDGGPSVTLTNDGTRTGWTWGAGVEYAFTDHWSGMIEYDYMDFGTKTTGACEDGDCESPFVNIKQVVNMVKAGVNYKFDWLGGKAPPPIVAKD